MTDITDPTSPFQYVTLAKIDIDPEYQRALNDERVEKLIQGFDPDLLDPPTLTPTAGGRFNAADGAHRIVMMIKLGFKQAWCRITNPAKNDRQAEIFVGTQRGRKALTAIEEHRAAVIAREQRAVEIDAAVRQHGLTIDKSGVAAVGSLQRVYDWGGADVVEKTVQIVKEAWGESGFPRPFTSSYVQGVGYFMTKFGHVLEVPDIIEALRTVSPQALQDKADNTKTKGAASSSAAYARYARFVREAYNKHHVLIGGAALRKPSRRRQ